MAISANIGGELRQAVKPSQANHKKQKNGRQKNGDDSAPIPIFLPAIFLLLR
jgi:hypothetical protein